jgi:hypothetical protein
MKQHILAQLFFSDRVKRNCVYGVKVRRIVFFRPINFVTGIYGSLVRLAGGIVSYTVRGSRYGELYFLT